MLTGQLINNTVPFVKPEDKKWLKECLKSEVVKITFTKKDGSDRTMSCTLKTDLIPKKEVVESVEKEDVELKLKKTKKVNDNVLPVFDVDEQEWRSFRWNSIKSISFKI